MRKFSCSQCLGITLAGVLSSGLLVAPAAAQTMKPGLWEVNNKMGGSGDMGAKMAAAMEQMKQQMASMSPEQRKQMEKMMAQQGVNMSPGSGGGMSTRVCVTKEMAARNEAPAQQQTDCKRESFQQSGNTTKFKFSCKNPPSTGEGTVTMHNPESYSMQMKVTRQGGADTGTMTMDAQGKWLGNDCGGIKPIKG